MKRSKLVAAAMLLLPGFAALAFGQNEAARALYVSAANVPTAVAGVHTYAEPPVGFNPLEATDEALAMYGFPPRPNASDPGFKDWVRAMSVAEHRKNEVKAMPFSSTQMIAANKPAQAPEAALTAGATQFASSNWSGVAVTNNITKWSKASSYGYVYSINNVPYAQPPFGACAAGITGPFYEVSWNGIDGALGKQGDVVQGGSLSYSDCGGPADNAYCAWVEWFPSYPVLCQFAVNPGDDVYVVSLDTLGGFNAPTVFVEDLTTRTYASVSLTYQSGPPELGDSAEWIVERPGLSTGLAALNNYIEEFFNDDFAYNVAGTLLSFPGSQATSTQLIYMVDDHDTQYISLVNAGSAGTQGRYSLWFEDDNCAYSGGCTP